MAERVIVKFKDKPSKTFENDRPGGSWEPTVAYEDGFVVVTDVWGSQFAYPAADILEVEMPRRRGF